MLTLFVRNHIARHIAAILITMVVLVPYAQIKVPALAQLSKPIKQIFVKPPCSESKQTETARSCQSQQTSSAKLYSLLSEFYLTFTSLTGKLAFLYVIAMLAACHARRIYRPPRLSLVVA